MIFKQFIEGMGMKALSCLSVIAIALFSSEVFADPGQYAQEAKAHFNQRDYTEAGIAHAREAAVLYGKAAAEAVEVIEKAQYLSAQSEALYFVGAAIEDNDEKIDLHDEGVKVGDQAVKLLGIADVAKITNAEIKELNSSLSVEHRKALAEAVYQRGANLGAWGQAVGVLQSLSKWPELRRSMEVIERLGFVDLHEYGPYRVLGRGYFKIPALMGGDLVKAERYLYTAFFRTKAKDRSISRNAYNNIYYAEILYQKGDETKAFRILEELINTKYEDLLSAEPEKFDPSGAVEFEEAQRQAHQLLKSW